MLPKRLRGFCCLWVCLLASCTLASPPVPATGLQPAGSPTRTPFQPVQNTALPEATRTPTAAPPPTLTPTLQPPPQTAVWVESSVPEALRQAVEAQDGYTLANAPEAAALRLAPGDQGSPIRWVYALVTPFPSLVQGVSTAQLRGAWKGEAAGPFAGRPLLMEPSTAAAFSAVWGPPANGAVQALPAGQLLDAAWNSQPSWAILPFEALEPRWKALEVDGLSPLHKDFDPDAYALAIPFSLAGEADLAQPLAALLPASNRDPGRLTVLAMTGVTALVRATAYTMEQKGVLYPGKDVRDWLRDADLTHISNEVPFAENCPYPDPVQQDMRFCSDPRYIALMEDVGTDIVELTGDHFQDWGKQAMLYTLDLYRQRGWLYYGGGANLAEGRQAITVEDHGNRLAFIGCNAKGGSYAQAGPDQPGAVRCDLDWMAQEVSRLRSEGYLPVVTFQHFEYYTYEAQPNQKHDFRQMADAGAVIVSGSQAHQPQALEFRNGALIHYGLGNLFFDQYDVSPACRQAFIDRHIFYDGRFIGTELLPILFIDYARPRPMDAGERNDLLKAVFAASGW